MIYSIGEALIDLYGSGPLAVRTAGGASANFCAAVSALGGNSALISAVGDDEGGEYLLKSLSIAGVNTKNVFVISGQKTGMIPLLKNNGNKTHCLGRMNSADMQLDEKHIAPNVFSGGSALHFCSLGLIESPLKHAAQKALQAASDAGLEIILDINFRMGQWSSAEECAHALNDVLPFVHYIKALPIELKTMYPEGDAKDAMFKRADRLKCLIVTSGDRAIKAYFRDSSQLSVSPFAVKAGYSAAGAGDCFMGAFVLFMERQGALASCITKDFKDSVRGALRYAAAAAAASINSNNAFYAPDRDEAESLLRGVQRI